MDPRFSDETIAFSQLAAHLFPSPDEYSFGIMRDKIDKMHITINEQLLGTFKGTLEEKQVKIDSTEIPITIYTPVDVNKDKLVVYFHGGGYVLCNRKTHQATVNMMADVTKTIWINVEYRLSPEYKYPIWHDDICDVTRHIIENKTSYGVHPKAKVGIAGDSAGATISATVYHTVKDIDFQILVYGGFNRFHETSSSREFSNPMYFMTPELRKWFYSNALDEKVDLNNSRLSIMNNPAVVNVPPCLFIVAELDPLRDYTHDYKELLDKAGAKTKLVLIKGVVHWFFGLPGIFPKASAQAADAIQEFMASI